MTTVLYIVFYDFGGELGMVVQESKGVSVEGDSFHLNSQSGLVYRAVYSFEQIGGQERGGGVLC